MQFHDQHFTAWGMTMESFRNGQKVIEKQRFQYPSDWLSISQVE
jgi:dynein heavy chain 1